MYAKGEVGGGGDEDAVVGEDEGVLALSANCPVLRRIKLSGAIGVTDTSIIALARSCPLLLEIDLNNCIRVTDANCHVPCIIMRGV